MGPSKRPAVATAERSRTESPMATAGRGGAAARDLGRKTPKGRFSRGKWESGGMLMKDLRGIVGALTKMGSDVPG